MRLLLTVVSILALVSCGRNSLSDKNDLLTNSIWTIERNVNNEKTFDAYRFKNDGTYLATYKLSKSEEIKVNGKWNWTKDGEIYLQTEGVTVKGEANDLDKKIISHIKIVELTGKNLRTLERHEDDAWDSGFAKEINYTSKNL